MEIIKNIGDIKNIIEDWKKEGYTIGFVPTMGFLHDGHASLVRQSEKENYKTVVSIFVNPIQFTEDEDLENYPRDMKHDKMICERSGADLIFNPDVEELYPAGFSTYVDVSDGMQGAMGKVRPGHFKGVCTVVNKFFNIIMPDKAYFGQKDAVQLSIIKKMVKDLNMNLKVIGCPTIREKNGLAMSSRNSYLNNEERAAAACLYKSLLEAKKIFKQNIREPKIIKESISSTIKKEPMSELVSVEIVDSENMLPVDFISKSCTCLLSVKIGKTLLIDNIIL